MEIAVSNQIVKKVGGKHRYFFDIRNNDKKNFEGSVTIKLFNQEQNSPLGEETFNTTSPITPGLGTSVYFDIYTGPTSVHGSFGISRFEYKVEVNGKVVKKGEGQISEKYEEL